MESAVFEPERRASDTVILLSLLDSTQAMTNPYLTLDPISVVSASLVKVGLTDERASDAQVSLYLTLLPLNSRYKAVCSGSAQPGKRLTPEKVIIRNFKEPPSG